MMYNALLMGKKTPKIVPYPLDFVTLRNEEGSTAIVNIHKKIGKDQTCSSEDILADRQRDTQTY